MRVRALSTCAGRDLDARNAHRLQSSFRGRSRHGVDRLSKCRPLAAERFRMGPPCRSSRPRRPSRGAAGDELMGSATVPVAPVGVSPTGPDARETNLLPLNRHLRTAEVQTVRIKTAAKITHLIWAGFWSIALLWLSAKEGAGELNREPHLIAIPLFSIAWLVFATALFFEQSWAWYGCFLLTVLSLFVAYYVAWTSVAIVLHGKGSVVLELI